MWNDEFPGGDPPVWTGGAHAKGVLGLDQASGFYLLHSVPKFPAAPCLDASLLECPDGIGNGSYTGIALVWSIHKEVSYVNGSAQRCADDQKSVSVDELVFSAMRASEGWCTKDTV